MKREFMDLSNVAGIAPKVVVPEGIYLLSVKSAKDAKSKAGNDMITTEFEIIEGDFEGVVLKHWFTFSHPVSMSLAKSYADFAELDASDFCGDSLMGAKPVRIKVEQEGNSYTNADGEEVETTQNKLNFFEMLAE